MKKYVFYAICVMAGMLLISCNKKQEKQVVAPEPVVEKQEVYQPVHKSTTIDLSAVKTYNYYPAPLSTAANKVTVTYDEKQPYTQPIRIKYGYANGDTYEYVIPADFGLWPNEAGKLRVVTDSKNTVWLQGQTKKGKFCEFVFYGANQNNNAKISQNSYLNPPTGKIDYRK